MEFSRPLSVLTMITMAATAIAVESAFRRRPEGAGSQARVTTAAYINTKAKGASKRVRTMHFIPVPCKRDCGNPDTPLEHTPSRFLSSNEEAPHE